MGVASSRSPAMAYKDGSIWCSTFDDAGKRCWVNSQTGEKTYHLVDGKPARRPSGTTSPYTVQSPGGQPWAATTSPVVHSSAGPVMHSPGPVMHSPGHLMHSPGHAMHSPGHAMHSPGHVMHSPGHVMHSPGHVMLSPGHVMHSPGHVMNSPGHVLRSPGPVMLSPGHATLATGFAAPQYPGTGVAPYQQSAHGATPTRAGEAVGYHASKSYVRPRRSKKAWMWTQN